jgi:hypothetical protein
VTDHTIEDDGPARVRPFAAILNDIRGGDVADQAAELMQELVAAVREHGKKGELVLKIAVEPMKGNPDALSVSGDVTSKPPRPTPVAAIFFADTDGNLLRDDPRQIALPGLRVLDKTTNATVKDIAK